MFALNIDGPSRATFRRSFVRSSSGRRYGAEWCRIFAVSCITSKSKKSMPMTFCLSAALGCTDFSLLNSSFYATCIAVWQRLRSVLFFSEFQPEYIVGIFAPLMQKAGLTKLQFPRSPERSKRPRLRDCLHPRLEDNSTLCGQLCKLSTDQLKANFESFKGLLETSLVDPTLEGCNSFNFFYNQSIRGYFYNQSIRG